MAFVLASVIIYILIRCYYIRIDDLGINTGVSFWGLIFYTLPSKLVEFGVAGFLSVYVVKKFPKLPKIFYYILPLLFIVIVFLLDLDFYHWTMRDYPLGRVDVKLINRSIFWKYILN